MAEDLDHLYREYDTNEQICVEKQLKLDHARTRIGRFFAGRALNNQKEQLEGIGAQIETSWLHDDRIMAQSLAVNPDEAVS